MEDYAQINSHFAYFQAKESSFSPNLGINFILRNVGLHRKLDYSFREAGWSLKLSFDCLKDSKAWFNFDNLAGLLVEITVQNFE